MPLVGRHLVAADASTPPGRALEVSIGLDVRRDASTSVGGSGEGEDGVPSS